MKYSRQRMEEEAEKLLSGISFFKGKEISGFLSEAQNPEFGDLACSICFSMAKELEKSPVRIAEEAVKGIRIPKKSFFSKAEAKAGYINFFLNFPVAAEAVLDEIRKMGGDYGKSGMGEGKKAMVEFSQPNPVHPMHIGHARTTFIGDSLSNILDFAGYKVVRANLMNDVGLQVAKLVTAYDLWAGGKEPEGKPDIWLWDFYVRFHEEEKSNPGLEGKARKFLIKFEVEKDKKAAGLWKKVVGWCVRGFEETYRNINVGFDVWFYESDFREEGKGIVKKAVEEGIAKEDDGAIVVDFEKYGLGKFVILRSDGTGLYYTSDLPLTIHKFEKYSLSKSFWIVSSEQNLYFRQLFKLLETLGYKWAKDCRHISFELVRLKEGKMSSREGKAIMLDEVFGRLVDLETRQLKTRDFSEKERKEISKKIALGALRYNILRTEHEKQITFDWERMLSVEGNTGPYLQYSYARANSILEKGGISRNNKINFDSSFFQDEKEKILIKILMEFPSVAKSSAEKARPHYVANYAYSLATAFNEFYQSLPVLKAEIGVKEARLSLIICFMLTLENALRLLGIETVEKM
ncbi:MAG: arginine--tRNA ligase [Candidatus Aenigmarchaeota archaeon]|nr:arginine--tRNA ligase [Candidatus Aenigmarchaeota archaeon]